jgi:hypothetical protein
MSGKKALIRTPEEYVDSLEGLAKEWIVEFLYYMDTKYPWLEIGRAHV